MEIYSNNVTIRNVMHRELSERIKWISYLRWQGSLLRH